MSLEIYKRVKQDWHDTKPIRGRADDIRPWGNRRKDHLQVIRVLEKNEEGQDIEVYGAKMHGTIVWRIYPNGDMLFNCGGWHTPTTSEFMGSLVYGFRVDKRYNKLWLRRTVGTETFCAVLNEPVLVKCDMSSPETFKHQYRLAKPCVAQQRVIDPIKAKALRAKAKAFKDYVKSMLSLSDGWLAFELVNTYKTTEGLAYGYGYKINDHVIPYYAMRNSKLSYEAREVIMDAISCTDEDKNLINFPALMCMLADTSSSHDGFRDSAYGFSEYRYEIKNFQARIDRVLFACEDVTKLKEVVITKPVTGIE